MKRYILILLLFLPALCHAQLPTILGIEFGSSYKNVKQILDARFNNGTSSYQSSTRELDYYDVEVGGMNFAVATFGFSNINGTPRLDYVVIYNSFDINNVTSAKSDRDYIKDIYSKKYKLRSFKADDGFINYSTEIFDEDGDSSVYINIYTYKGKTKGGTPKYFSGVKYIYESESFNESELNDI